MKFRKLVLCLFIGVFLLNFTNAKAYASEEITAILEENKAEISTELDKAETTNEVTTEATTEVTTNEVTDKETTKNEETNIEENNNEETTKEQTSQEVKKEVKKETKKYTNAELRLLSALIYCEARGESYNGKLAVGIVVMNRKRSYNFPNSIKSVIYQKYQFSPVTNGTLKRALAEYDKGRFTSATEKECIKAAKAALNGAKSITVNGKKKSFSKYLYFSGGLRGYTFKLGNHRFK